MTQHRYGESAVTALSTHLTYYVSATGSDVTGTGVSSNPFATIQNAYTVAARSYDFSGYNFTIQVSSGTFAGLGTGLGVPSLLRCSQFTLKGDNTTPANVTLTRCPAVVPTIDTACVAIFGNNDLYLSGFTLVVDWASGIAVDAIKATVFLGEPTFTEPSKCIYTIGVTNARVFVGGIYDLSLAVSQINYAGFTAGQWSFFSADQVPPGAVINLYGPDFNINDNPAYTGGFGFGAFVGGNGQFLVSTAGTFGGSATGKRFTAGGGCYVVASGETALLGDTAGVFLSGGGFIDNNQLNYLEQINAINTTYSGLPLSFKEGMIFLVTDSPTTVIGSPLTSGGGTHHVLVYYQTGTSQWIVIGAPSPVPSIHSRVSKTSSNYNIDLTVDNGKTFDNIGSTMAVNLNLPSITSSSVGSYVGVSCIAPQQITLTAPSSVTISYATVTSCSAGTIASTTPYSNMQVEAFVSSSWIINYAVGTWAIT